jgi:hypothetical protein
MVAPPSRDLEVPGRKTFQPESQALDERDRPQVSGLNVCLQPMEATPPESARYDEADARRHVPSPLMWHERVEAEIARLKHPADDFADVDHSDELAIRETHEMSFMSWRVQSSQVSPILLASSRGRHEAVV